MRTVTFERRTVRRWPLTGSLLLALGLAALCAQALHAQAGVQGQWRTLLPPLMPINPVHLALLNNGKVLIVAGSGNVATETNYQAAVWDPQAETMVTQSLAWDMFCNGMVMLPDGRVFINGGNLQYDPFHGEPRNSAYDPATGFLPDATVLLVGGNPTRGSYESHMAHVRADDQGNQRTGHPLRQRDTRCEWRLLDLCDAGQQDDQQRGHRDLHGDDPGWTGMFGHGESLRQRGATARYCHVQSPIDCEFRDVNADRGDPVKRAAANSHVDYYRNLRGPSPLGDSHPDYSVAVWHLSQESSSTHERGRRDHRGCPFAG